MLKQQQQGDVLLQQRETLPTGAQKVGVKGQRVILAEGEVTGHAHAITEKEYCELWTAEDRHFLRVHARVTLRHEEHSAQVLEPGVYEYWQVRERDFLSGMVNPVRD